MTEQLKQLEQLIPVCMVQKRFAFGCQISKIKQLVKAKKPVDEALFKLSGQIVKNVESAQARLASTPTITFDDSFTLRMLTRVKRNLFPITLNRKNRPHLSRQCAQIEYS